MVLGQGGPCPVGLTWRPSCPVTLWAVMPGPLATMLCWENVGRGGCDVFICCQVAVGPPDYSVGESDPWSGWLGTLLWGPWKGVMEGRPDPGGRTENWEVVASSHVPIPQGTSLPASRALGACLSQPGLCSTAHTWFVRSVSRSSDTSSLLSSRRTIFCRSSSSMKPFSLKSARRRHGLRERTHRLPPAYGMPCRSQLSPVSLEPGTQRDQAGLRSGALPHRAGYR